MRRPTVRCFDGCTPGTPSCSISNYSIAISYNFNNSPSHRPNAVLPLETVVSLKLSSSLNLIFNDRREGLCTTIKKSSMPALSYWVARRVSQWFIFNSQHLYCITYLGLGKTTLAHIIAAHAGYNTIEINARFAKYQYYLLTITIAVTTARLMSWESE